MLLIPLLTTASAADSISLKVDGFDLNLDGALARAITSEIRTGMLSDSECSLSTDPQARRALAELDKSKRSTARFTGEDGEEIVATRNGDSLSFVVDEADGTRAQVTVPWVLGECALGKDVDRGALANAKTLIDLVVTGPDGERFVMKID